jgi:two-component system, NtrC family, response regulator PilR
MRQVMICSADKPTLMIVDDERNFTESLRLAIEDVYSVSIVGSLERARELLKNWLPAAILLDLRLSDGEGIELLRELKNSSRMPVVIVMTAFATVDSFIKAQHEGAVDYFPKPLDILKLKKALRMELEKRALQ